MTVTVTVTTSLSASTSVSRCSHAVSLLASAKVLEAMAALEGYATSIRNGSSFLPSATDLLFAVPRLAQRAGSFALFYLPDQLDEMFSIVRSPGSSIADATAATSTHNLTTMTSTASFLQVPMATGVAVSATDGQGFFSFLKSAFSLQRLSNLDSVFSYLASRWAVSTFFIVCHTVNARMSA